MPVTIRRLDPQSTGARELIGELDAYLAGLYPAASNHLDPVDELAKPHVHFRGAWLDQELVGCGAAKIMDDGAYGEIKRVYVRAAARGRGIARAIMQDLEATLLRHGVHCARLETGTHQPEALELFEMLGYHRRGPFGAYAADPLSLFMEKRLSS